jgi:iron complex outermembrane receptor protein
VTKRKSYAAYAQGTLDLSRLTGLEGLSAIAGARYTIEKVSLLHRDDDVFVLNPQPNYVNFQKDTFKKLSWQFGLQQQVNPRLMLYATTRRSFRSGGFNFFAAPIPGLGNEGGAKYALEEATDVELGAKYQGYIGNAPLRVNLSAYHLWIKDIQRATYVQIAGAPGVITVNVPQTKIKGIELDGNIRPARWLSLGGSLNLTDPKFTKNVVQVLGNPGVAFGPFPDVAKFSGNVYAEVSVPVASGLRGTLRGDLYSQSSTYYSSTANTLNPGTKLPGYSLVNLRAGIESDKGWSVAAIVKNATNKVYYVGGFALGSLFTLNTVLPGEPRTFLAELKYRY